MKKLLFAVLVFLFIQFSVNAQNDFWSNNGLVSIKDGAYLSIVGDAYNQNSGIYDNSDSIFITGNWTHNAANRGFDSIGKGSVYLNGADQHIAGNSITHFYNLTLSNQGIKYGDIDVYVDNNLDLQDRELNMGTKTVWELNPQLTSIARTSGYVSSLEDGGLLRYTNQTQPYLFPLGSSSGTTRYRPLEFKPLADSINIYKARFANVDPTLEGFNRDNRYHLVCQINPDWYHRLYHIAGSTPADITVMYDTTADGSWNDLAHWQNLPEWESIHQDATIAGAAFNRMSKFTWNDYSYSPIALATTSNSFAIAEVDTIIWASDTIQLNALGGSAYNWSPDFNLSCTDCPNPLAWPDSSVTYMLSVTNGTGCTAYDTLRVEVKDRPFSLFFIPNAITPNGDGYNDYWLIKDLERYPDNEVRIINRWGDEVFSQAPYQNNWTGTWNGQELPGGTYYYVLKIHHNGDDVKFDGPLTIVR